MKTCDVLDTLDRAGVPFTAKDMAAASGVSEVDASVALLRAHRHSLVAREGFDPFIYSLTEYGRARLAYYDARFGSIRHGLGSPWICGVILFDPASVPGRIVVHRCGLARPHGPWGVQQQHGCMCSATWWALPR
jgi:hypothetical protein